MEPTGVGINVPIKQNSMTRSCPHEWIVLHWRAVFLVTEAASIACGRTSNKDWYHSHSRNSPYDLLIKYPNNCLPQERFFPQSIQVEVTECFMLLGTEIHRYQKKNIPFMGNETVMIIKVYCVIRADSRLAPSQWETSLQSNPDSKVHGANMGPTWVLSAPDGPHVGPMNLVTREHLSHWLGANPE